jgi:hypothetical protein
VAAYDDLLRARRRSATPVQRSAPSGSTDDPQTVAWPVGYTPNCPDCGHPTAGLREQRARVRGIREPVILTIADPCGCPVDDHAAALQAAAPANQIGSGLPTEPAI